MVKRKWMNVAAVGLKNLKPVLKRGKSEKNKWIVAVCTLLLVAVCFAGCNEQNETPVADFEYEMVDGEIVITGYTGTAREIYIPAVINERPVTQIGEEAFAGYDMTLIELPDSIKIIHHSAFADCVCLEKVRLPAGLERIEFAAFDGCEALKKVDLPDGLKFMGMWAFGGCENMKELVIPVDFTGFDVVKMMGVDEIRSPVSDCTTLVVRKGSKALNCIQQYGHGKIKYRIGTETKTEENKPLSEIILDALTGNDRPDETPASAFEYEEYLGEKWSDEINIPAGIQIKKYIGTDDVVVIPKEIDGLPVVAIGSYAFNNCDSIKEIYFSENVALLGLSAFESCDELVKVVLPDREVFLLQWAFARCTKLKEVVFSDNQAWLEMSVFKDCTTLENVELPDKVTLCNGVFSGCTLLKKLEIPEEATFVRGLPIGEEDETILIVTEGSPAHQVLQEEKYIGKVEYEVRK